MQGKVLSWTCRGRHVILAHWEAKAEDLQVYLTLATEQDHLKIKK